MRRALALAERGRGLVEPNPMVGALIVRDGRVLGEGFHRRFGGAHAEVEALRACGRESPRGATCFVSLEPCCHFGKTPPCTDALIAAGVARVVAAVRDPNPRVSGGGLSRLRRAGVRVEVGLLEREARELNAPFFKLNRAGRPWVILKWAQSLDGKIATRSGESKWITSVASRRMAHVLRGRVDAIVVGVGTVIADDPELTCRDATARRIAARIVLDPRARTPASSRLVRTARKIRTIIVTGPQQTAAARRLAHHGCEILPIQVRGGRMHLPTLLARLGQEQMTNVMIEGGGTALGGFMDAGLADEAMVFVAPRVIGGREAPGPLGGKGPPRMRELPNVRVLETGRAGPDWWYRLGLGPEIQRPARVNRVYTHGFD